MSFADVISAVGDGTAGLRRLARNAAQFWRAMFHRYHDWSIDRWRLALWAAISLFVGGCLWASDLLRAFALGAP